MVDLTETEQRELVEALNATLDIEVTTPDYNDVTWTDTHLTISIKNIMLPDPAETDDELPMSVNHSVENAIVNALEDLPVFNTQQPTVHAEMWSPTDEKYR